MKGQRENNGIANLAVSLDIEIDTPDVDAEEIALRINGGHDVSIEHDTTLQANLFATANNASIIYCSDCNPDATCTAAGAGAFAFRIAGAWACELN